MNLRTALATRAAAFVLAAAVPVSAATPGLIRALDRIMASVTAESAQASAEIREAYRDHLDFLLLAAYGDMAGALDNGGLVPLPDDVRRFNLMPRLGGPHPIGEKDLPNQRSYIAARPATIGMLVEIASQVKSGPLEITSLVRHGEYQQSLQATNANANTSVPMHTMGLAVDIALINTPLERAYEIRDVLRKMQKRGDILFIGERRQLVFHVVPHPSRLGHFTEVYMRKVGLPPTSRSAHVVAAAPAGTPVVRRPGPPQVTAEVLSFLPLVDPFAVAAIIEAVVEEPEPVRASPVAAAAVHDAASAGRILRRWTVLLAALLIVGWRIAARPAVRPDLLDL